MLNLKNDSAQTAAAGVVLDDGYVDSILLEVSELMQSDRGAQACRGANNDEAHQIYVELENAIFLNDRATASRLLSELKRMAELSETRNVTHEENCHAVPNKFYYMQIFGKEKSEMLEWAAHYIGRGARITFFKGSEADAKRNMQPCVFWDGLPKDESGKTIYWVHASLSYVEHMLDIGADGMKVNASDLARSEALEALGLSLRNQGLRLAPIGANKKAYWKCIDPVVKTKKDGSGTYKTYSGALDAHWESGPTTSEQVKSWVKMGTPALAALCGEASGGLYILDIDVERFLDKFLAQDGVRDILTRHKVPIERTGGGGWQLWFKVEPEVPPNTKYAYALNPAAKEGREVAIESRGVPRGYGLTPQSLHPSGAYYEEDRQIFGGSFDHIPTISQEELIVLENGAKATCEAPKPIKNGQMGLTANGSTRGKPNKPPKPTSKAPKPASKPTPARVAASGTYIQDALATATPGADASVIEVVNDALDVARTLESFGYTHSAAGRYSHPDASAGGGVSIKDNRSFHHSTNDRLHYDNELDGTYAPLNIKRTRTPFDVICAYQYNGNRKKAVRSLAKKLGLYGPAVIDIGQFSVHCPPSPPDVEPPSAFKVVEVVQPEETICAILEINNEAAFEFVKTQEPVFCPLATTTLGYRLMFKLPNYPISECTLLPNQPSLDLRLRLCTGIEDANWIEGASFSDFPDGPPDAPGWLLALIRSAMEWVSDAPTALLTDFDIGQSVSDAPPPPPPPPPPTGIDDYDYGQLADMMPLRCPVAPIVEYGDLNGTGPAIEQITDVEYNVQVVTHESNISLAVEDDLILKSFYASDQTGTAHHEKILVWYDARIDLSQNKTWFAEKTPEPTQYIIRFESELRYTSYTEYQSDDSAPAARGVRVLIPDADSKIGSIKSITRRNGEHNHVTFKHGQYISGVWGIAMKHANLFGTCLLSAMTGTGKTYEWAHYEGKSVLAVPTKALARQVAEAYRVFAVYEDQDIDSMPDHCTKIVSTYDSVKKVSEYLMRTQHEDLREWNLTVDEAHLLTTEGSYRLKGINNLTSFFNDFGSVIAMSATLPLDLMRLTHFQDAALVECVPSCLRAKIKLLHTNRDYIAQTKQLLNLGVKLVIIHANDKSFCEAYRSVFEKENIKAITFTADTKSEEQHDAIIQKSEIDDSVQVILTTNIFNCGLSIKPRENHAIIITHKSRLLPRDICQVAARMRHGLNFQNPDFLLVATRRIEIDMSNTGNVFDYKKPYAEEFNQAAKVLRCCESVRSLILERGSASKTNLDEVLDKFHENAYIKAPEVYTDPYEINIDAVVAFVSNRHRATLNTGQILFELEATGLFEYHGEFEYQADGADDDVKSKVKEVAARKKATREETYQRIVSGAASKMFEQNAIKELESVVENHKDHDTFEIEAAGGILSIYRNAKKLSNGVKFSGVIKLVENVKSKAGFKKLKDVVLFSVANSLTEKQLEEMKAAKARLVRQVLDCEISDENALKLCEMVAEWRALRDIKMVCGVRITRKREQAIRQIIKDTSVRQDALILRELGQLVVPGEKLTKNEMEERRKKAFCLGISDMFDIRTTEKMTRLIKKFFKCKKSKKEEAGKWVHAVEIIERVNHIPALTL
ncbi:MAG: hypothetical protein ACPGWR_13535 [Ardenticatenaceae bacterium]